MVKVSPYLMEDWNEGFLSPEEIERRALGARRLSESFSSIPFHAERAKHDPDYWNKLYRSCVNR